MFCVLVISFFFVIARVAIVPVLASLGLAYLLNPIVQKIEKRGPSRTTSSLAAIALVGFITVGFLSYVVPELWVETSKAVTKLSESFTPQNAKRQRALLKRYSPPLERLAGDHIEEFLSDPTTAIGNMTSASVAAENAPAVQKSRWSNEAWILSNLISSLDLLLVPFFVFYILVDFPRWRTASEALIPPRYRDPFRRLFDESGRILEAYVRGQIVIGLIMAVCYGLGFWMLGVPAWAGIALLAGLLNAIPYLGTVLGVALAGAFTISSGGGGWDLAAVLGIFVAVQTLEGYVLTPRILGGHLSLHPMAVFLGLLIGGKLFGLLGVILTIPTIAIAKVFLKFLRELYQGSSFYTGSDSGLVKKPETKLEERIAQAADVVLAEQGAPDDPPPEESETAQALDREQTDGEESGPEVVIKPSKAGRKPH